MFGMEITDLAFLFTVAVAVGGLLIAIVFPMISANNASRRVDAIATGKKDTKSSFRQRFQEDSKDSRRRQIQESRNKQNEDRVKAKKGV